jgi:hypothetical protein
MPGIRLLVIGEFVYSSGSSNVLREYVRAASGSDVQIQVSTEFGRSDRRVRAELPHTSDSRWATHAAVIYEGRPFLDEAALSRLDQLVPRGQRVVVDCDGHRSPLVQVGRDNNAWPCGAASWQAAFDDAGVVTLQPALAAPPAGTIAWPYFGFPNAPGGRRWPRRQDLDVQYVGNNWFRAEVLLSVFAAARRARPTARLRVRGRGWDGSSLPGLEHATYADPEAFRRLGVEVRPSAPFGKVVDSLGKGAITPVLVRQVLSRLALLTPRMLETSAATTLPVYLEQDRYISNLYEDGGAFCLDEDPAGHIEQLLDDLPRWRILADELSRRLRERYNYSANLAALKGILADL